MSKVTKTEFCWTNDVFSYFLNHLINKYISLNIKE